MNSKIQKTSFALTLSAALLIASHAAGQERFLPRSMYVPINFTLCEHLRDAVLYEGEQAVAAMPAKRVFQFTYFPDLNRIVPDAVQIRIEGSYVDSGEPFVARLAVSPFGIHTAHRQVALHYTEPLKRLRFNIDTRYQAVNLRIRCDTICSKSKRTVAEADDGDDDPPEPPYR